MVKTKSEKTQLTLGTIISLVGISLAVAGAVAALLSNIYCSKSELADAKAEVKDEVTTIKVQSVQAAGDAKLQAWQVSTVQTQVQNMEKRQIQMSENLDRLLQKFNVHPTSPPVMTPMPAPPKFKDKVLDVGDGK